MFRTLNHKAYIVGGAVRDEILNIPSKDVDYVIEASQEEFEAVFPDYKRVDIMDKFPVYLDHEGNEIALTREDDFENGNGDKNVMVKSLGTSIINDLKRRDFSINSIAKEYLTGNIIDPYNGVQDIHNKIIRTINDRFVVEDPNRVYRLARFVAVYKFSVDKHTADIVNRDRNNVKSVLPERIYAELKKVYERSEKPSLFFTTLLDLGILDIHFKPLYLMSKISSGPNKYHNGKTAFEHGMDSFDYAKANGFSFDVALAGLFHDTGKGISKKVSEGEQHHYGHEIMSYAINKKFIEQHRFTAKQNELIVTFARQHMYFHLLEKIKNPVKLIRFFKKIRKYADDIIQASNTDHPLNAEQIVILNNLKRTFTETVINIPTHIHAKGKDAVVNFVEQRYVEKYREISK